MVEVPKKNQEKTMGKKAAILTVAGHLPAIFNLNMPVGPTKHVGQVSAALFMSFSVLIHNSPDNKTLASDIARIAGRLEEGKLDLGESLTQVMLMAGASLPKTERDDDVVPCRDGCSCPRCDPTLVIAANRATTP